ncbi:SPOR domain-containing protein [Acidobacteriota bacterium]
MSSKDYRELQLSSSQLVIIFLAIIILGVIIFLLGISVGKKRTEIVLASQPGTEQVLEKIPIEESVPVEDPKPEPVEKTTPPQKTESQPVKAAPTIQPQNLNWFIQVGAFRNQTGAQATADKLKAEGLNVIVLDPDSSRGGTLFRVRIGGYATKDLAEKAKAELVRSDPNAKDYMVINQR